MSIWPAESSIQNSQPIGLLHFTCGASHWRQNTSPLAVSYDGFTYDPQPGLAIGDIEDSGNFLKSSCDIYMSWSNPLLSMFPAIPPDAIITVVIYRMQGAEAARWWSGFVLGGRRQKDRKAALRCVASFSALGVGSLCIRVSRACPVPLYSTPCGLNIEDWQGIGTVDSISGLSVTSSRFLNDVDENSGVVDDGYWAGGKIEINGYSRLIETHTGDTITIAQAIPGLEPGLSFTASPGCSHTIETCLNKFNNSINYRGFFRLPQGRNPFTGGVY